MKMTPLIKSGDFNLAEMMFLSDTDTDVFRMKCHDRWDHVIDEKSRKAWDDAVKNGDIEIKLFLKEHEGHVVYFLLRVTDLLTVPVYTTHSDGTFYRGVNFFHKREEEREIILEKLKAIWPENKPNFEDHRVLVNFWVNTPHGPRNISRYIEVNDFNKIKDNYSYKTKEVVQKIVDHIPTKTGQIVLLSGDPGTGKTHALRSILWEWRNRAEFNYIIDPMAFFGGDPVYLTQVLFNESSGPDTPKETPFSSKSKKQEQKWRVFILEDSEELLTIDAKEKVGQALSQLFNVTDGMIGQGLKLLFFMTTNVKIEKFHPAISRPGRCAVKHEFTKLSIQESEEWLWNHAINPDGIAHESHTIAELYEMLDRYVIHTDGANKKEIGFAAARI
jgi:hypothetical protein